MIKKAAVLHFIETGSKTIAYDQITKKALLMTGKEAAKQAPKEIVKRYAVKKAATLTANAVANADTDEEVTGTDYSSISAGTTDSKPETTSDTKEQPEVSADRRKEFDDFEAVKDEYKLKVAKVGTASELGNIKLSFKTPERTREDDDNTGKLILEESEIFEQVDLTENMKDYDTPEDLLNDLKIVGKKSENKEQIRERELKKWQKTDTFSTPYINSMNTRYEFHFLIRERAKISFFKKNHEENIEFASFIDGLGSKEYGSLELNGSLYLIAKKVK
jgi:hypothetical protein